MISKKRLTITFLILLLGLLFFNNVPNVYASQIHSFSINNEGKYFIDYFEGANLSKVEMFRNDVIKIMPLVEKWGGISFDKLEIVIIPDSFDNYQKLYGGTEIWKMFNLVDKKSYDGIFALSLPVNKKFIIKESERRAIYHEASHLSEYPFGFDHYFSEGEANNGAAFIAKGLGQGDIFDNSARKKAYSQLSPGERKIYNTSLNAIAVDARMYQVGTAFIEKILNKTGVEDLSAFYINLRNDFSDVIKKYEEHQLLIIWVNSAGQEITGKVQINLDSAVGQEVVQCEMIKTYGEKVASVFAEFGYPDAVNCDTKIRDFKEERLKDIESWLNSIKTGVFIGHEISSEVVATEQDQWIKSEVAENNAEETNLDVVNNNENNQSNVADILQINETIVDEPSVTDNSTDNNTFSWIYIFIGWFIFAFIVTGLIAIVGVTYYLIKKQKKKK